MKPEIINLEFPLDRILAEQDITPPATFDPE